jgi:hypothetical protein
VGEFLAGVDDRLHVDHRHRRVADEAREHAVFQVHAPVDELRERADGDHVAVSREHACCLADVLLCVTVHDAPLVEGHLPTALAGLEDDGVGAELERADLEGAARAQRGVEEE